MTQYKRVKGHSKLLKDPLTGVIINSDVREIENAILMRKVRKEKGKEIKNIMTTNIRKEMFQKKIMIIT